MEISITRQNFSEIIKDSHFFEDHSDETLQLLVKYQRIIEDVEEQKPITRLLNFGCGDGRFLKNLIKSKCFQRFENMGLTLVETDIQFQAQALQNLGHLFNSRLQWLDKDLNGITKSYQLILANQALFYVDDLKATTLRLIDSLEYGGRLVLTLSRFDHPLTRLVESLAQYQGMSSPLHSSVQLFKLLYQYGFYYETYDVPSVLRFQNSESNRRKIVHYALGKNQNLYQQSIVNNFFDIHTFNNEVVIPLLDQIIVIDA
jgi:hypothetical protein